MMSELFDEKYLREQYDRAVRIESRAEGMAKGMAKGMEKGRAEGLAKGKAEGMAEGKADEKIRTVQRMLSINKFSLDEIAAISALTIEQVRKIAEDNKPVRT